MNCSTIEDASYKQFILFGLVQVLVEEFQRSFLIVKHLLNEKKSSVRIGANVMYWICVFQLSIIMVLRNAFSTYHSAKY